MDKDNWDSVKYQLSVQRRSLSMEGFLNLANRNILSLADLGTQPRLKILNLSNMPIVSLETLPPQPDLRQIIADNSRIESYAGISRHPRLQSISMIDTPISLKKDFRLTCLVLVGERLNYINGKLATDRQKLQANCYPLIARYLIESGWTIEKPVPSPDRFRELAIEYRLKIKGVDSEFSNDESRKYFRPPPSLILVSAIDDVWVDELSEEKAKDNSELVGAIQGQLRKIGINVNDEAGVLSVLSSLCGVVAKLEQCSDQITGEGEEQIQEEEEMINE